MRITCDICEGALLIDAGGNTATCQTCGMAHSIERVREKMGVGSVAKPVVEEEIYDATFVKVEDDVVYDAEFEEVVEDAEFEVIAEDAEIADDVDGSDETYDELHARIARYLSIDMFKSYTVEENVAPTAVGADPRCMTIDFVLKRDGAPVLAIAVLKAPRRKHGAVTGMIDACRAQGIRYIDFFVGKPNRYEYVIEKVDKALCTHYYY